MQINLIYYRKTYIHLCLYLLIPFMYICCSLMTYSLFLRSIQLTILMTLVFSYASS